MKKIYVGCSLMHATQEFRDSIEALKDELRKEHEIVDFLGFGNGTPQEIFAHDQKSVLACDLMLAECSYPSTGLGIELGIALSHNKPIIAVAKKDALVSPMIVGISHKDFSYTTYVEPQEIIELVRKKVAELL